MKLLTWFFPALVMTLALAPTVGAAEKTSFQSQLASAMTGPQRSAAHKARDRYRHPQKTLEFFGVRPNMRVVEVLPEGGWYTEILAPYLHDHGQLIEASTPTNSANPFLRRMATNYQGKLHGDPAVYGHVQVEPFALPDYLALGTPDSADRVLTFRNMHDMIFDNVHVEMTDEVMQRFLRSAFQVLKPGGVLGIVAHRANPDMPPAKSSKLGRLPQAFLVQEARRAGFSLAGSSEINANPRDDRKLPVWVLPPTLRQGDKDRARYEKIGEADNMTLKFVKPQTAL